MLALASLEWRRFAADLREVLGRNESAAATRLHRMAEDIDALAVDHLSDELGGHCCPGKSALEWADILTAALARVHAEDSAMRAHVALIDTEADENGLGPVHALGAALGLPMPDYDDRTARAESQRAALFTLAALVDWQRVAGGAR